MARAKKQKKQTPTAKLLQPAEQVEVRRIDKIKPYEDNPRHHTKAQVDHLAALMKRYGIDQPIVVDEDGVILKGHGRRLAAIEAGFTSFPVVVHRGLNDDDKKAMRIADNQTALLAAWDEKLLKAEVWKLPDDFNFNILGFTSKRLQDLLKPATTRGDPDAAPPAPTKPVVRPGDVWTLGEHRLVCGDAMDVKAWHQLMDEQVGAMVFTDPPYGVSYKAETFEVIEGDKKRQDELYSMVSTALKNAANYTRATAGFYIWHASATRNDFYQAMIAAGLIERQYLIWAKAQAGMGFADYRWAHEPCFYASKTDKRPDFYGQATDETVWRVAQTAGGTTSVVVGNGLILLDGKGNKLFLQGKPPKAKKIREIRLTEENKTVLVADEGGTLWEVGRDRGYIHPTQKPVELARRAIENSSKRGDIVIDAFSGAFSTGIACEMTGRQCRAIELDPAYAEVSIERWETYSGKVATRQDGKTLLELRPEKKERSHVKNHSGVAVQG